MQASPVHEGRGPRAVVRSFVLRVGPALLLWAAAAGAVAQSPAAKSKRPAVAPPAEASAYAIGAGDRLKLFVWKEAELTQEIVVRVDGMITVPLIGDVHAAGLTTTELSALIQEKLAQYVNSPSVTVGLIGAQSAQFFIVGKVGRPGAYPLDKPITFLQALALCGGFQEFAKSERVLIFRVGEPQPRVVNYKRLEGGADPAENIQLRSGDTLVVP